MAVVLGFILIFMLGGAIGAWATYDYLRYRGMLSSVRQQAEAQTCVAIEQLLDCYHQASQRPPLRPVASPDPDQAA